MVCLDDFAFLTKDVDYGFFEAFWELGVFPVQTCQSLQRPYSYSLLVKRTVGSDTTCSLFGVSRNT